MPLIQHMIEVGSIRSQPQSYVESEALASNYAGSYVELRALASRGGGLGGGAPQEEVTAATVAAATVSQELSHLTRPLGHHAQGPNIP